MMLIYIVKQAVITANMTDIYLKRAEIIVVAIIMSVMIDKQE